MQSGRHSFYCTLELSCPHDNLSAIPPATKVAGFLASFYEFLGDAAVHGGTYTLETDGDDSWIEFGVGANFNLNKNLYGWVDLERTEGADLDEDWRANVGVRYSF